MPGRERQRSLARRDIERLKNKNKTRQHKKYYYLIIFCWF